MPVMVLLLFGIIQYSLVMASEISLRHASTVAVRYAAVHDASEADLRANIEGIVGTMLVNPSSVVVDLDKTQQILGEDVDIVTLTYDMPLLIPFVYPGSSGSTVTINASSTMQKKST